MTAETSLRWVDLGPTAGFRFEPGAIATIDGHEFAVFAIEDGYGALDNSCPHSGASLAAGCLEDGRVFCPWHGWEFELRTGYCVTMEDDSTRSYAVRQVDGVLQIGLPADWTP